MTRISKQLKEAIHNSLVPSTLTKILTRKKKMRYADLSLEGRIRIRPKIKFWIGEMTCVILNVLLFSWMQSTFGALLSSSSRFDCK